MPEYIAPADAISTASDGSPIPLQPYIVQINKVDQTPSKKHAAQDKLELEILAPETALHNGQPVAVAGRKSINFYITYSKANLANCRDTLKKLGVEFDETKPWAVPSTDEVSSGAFTRIPEIQDITADLVGKQFVVKLSSEQQPERVPQPGQTKAKFSDPIKTDANGQVIYSTFYRANLIDRDDIISGVNDPVSL